MGYKYFMNNPVGFRTEDCSVRTISKILDVSWDDAFDILSESAKEMGLMPSDKSVMAAVLRKHGFYREKLPMFCSDCYSIRDFARNNPYGEFVVATDNHVVPIIDGTYYDSWDSGDEIPQYFWVK